LPLSGCDVAAGFIALRGCVLSGLCFSCALTDAVVGTFAVAAGEIGAGEAKADVGVFAASARDDCDVAAGANGGVATGDDAFAVSTRGGDVTAGGAAGGIALIG